MTGSGGSRPDWLERAVRERDKECAYCGVEFTPANVSAKAAARWGHILNDAKFITGENIVLCCRGCNASKGQKQLSVWLQSKYCNGPDISPNTVAPVIKRAIENEQRIHA